MKIEFPASIELTINNQPEKFELDFNVCHNPGCDCNGIKMVIYNENRNLNLFLDFSAKSYNKDGYSEEETKILDKLIEFLNSEENHSLNLNFFKEHYDYVKNQVKNKRDVLNSIELGAFMYYRDILWEEGDLLISIDGKNYFIADSYCVTPSCSCTEVNLNFFEEVHKLGPKTPDFIFCYDYMAGTHRDSIRISKDKIKEIIPILQKSYSNKFKKRRGELKKEVENEINKKIEERGFVREKPAKRRLGRNEPCHCGSGNKYKKCCLNKDLEIYGKAVKVS